MFFTYYISLNLLDFILDLPSRVHPYDLRRIRMQNIPFINMKLCTVWMLGLVVLFIPTEGTCAPRDTPQTCLKQGYAFCKNSKSCASRHCFSNISFGAGTTRIHEPGETICDTTCKVCDGCT